MDQLVELVELVELFVLPFRLTVAEVLGLLLVFEPMEWPPQPFVSLVVAHKWLLVLPLLSSFFLIFSLSPLTLAGHGE